MSNEQVFISYAEPNSEFAHRLAGDLEAHGMDVWIAPESVRPGETWVDAIDRGLSQSDYLVVTLTPAAMESDWVRKETSVGIMLERKGQLRLIPLDVEPADVGPLLSSYQMVSFREGYTAGFERLSNELGIGAAEPTAPRRHREPATSRPTPDHVELEPLTAIISHLIGVEPTEIRAGSNLVTDLEMDELDIVELIMVVEDEYGIDIPDADVFANPESPSTEGWRLRTVGELANYVQERLDDAGVNNTQLRRQHAPTMQDDGPPQQGSRPAAATPMYEARSFYSQPLWWVSLVLFPLIGAVAAIFTHMVLAAFLSWLGLFLPRGDAAFLVLAVAGLIWGLLYAADGASYAQEPSEYVLAILGPYDDLLNGVDSEDRIRGLLAAIPVNILVTWGIANAIGFALWNVVGGIDPLIIYASFALLSLEGMRRYIGYIL